MASGAHGPDLDKRLEEIRQLHGETIPFDKFANLVTRFLDHLTSEPKEPDSALLSELSALATFIDQSRHDIAAIQTGEVGETLIPGATDELDAIVMATAEATDRIMDSAEAIEGVARDVGGEAEEKILGITTGIYEACSFQDITGQRITKVIDALKSIEAKVDALVDKFGGQSTGERRKGEAAAVENAKLSDAELLNGPQLPEKASKQDEIDALFASLD